MPRSTPSPPRKNAWFFSISLSLKHQLHGILESAHRCCSEGDIPMTHMLHISDEKFQVVETLAAERGQTAEELIDALVGEAWERACAKHDAAFQNDPDWLEGAREAAAEAAAGHATFYPSTEAFFRHLGADEDKLEAARRLDEAEGANANVR
jgi:hypothetical protein